jgi:hypothetical protein
MADDVIVPETDAATRKLWRLIIEAEGAQHNSTAAMALAQFNRDLATDYAAANAAAEAEELAIVPVEDETDDEVDVEEALAEAEEHTDHSSRSRSRKRR